MQMRRGYAMGDRLLRPAQVFVAGRPGQPTAESEGKGLSRGRETGLLRTARRRPDGVAGRGQEGLPQARHAVPPGPQPRQQERRAEVQGDLRGLRGAERRRRSGSSTTSSATTG